MASCMYIGSRNKFVYYIHNTYSLLEQQIIFKLHIRKMSNEASNLINIKISTYYIGTFKINKYKIRFGSLKLII